MDQERTRSSETGPLRHAASRGASYMCVEAQPEKAAPSDRHLSSLREYLGALRDLGELQEVAHEVDWNLEIGALTRRCYETGAPAPLFSRVKGVEPGFRAPRVVTDAPCKR